MRVSRALRCAPLLLLLAACDEGLRELGEECSTSTECEPMLLCDTTLEPPTCQSSGAPRPDLSGAADDLASND